MKFISNFSDIQEEEKPREKMMFRGPQALSPWELIAILLRTGTRSKSGGEDVMQLSQRIVAEFGLKGLFHHQSDIPELVESAGIYKSHAEILIAIGEIFRRISESHDHFDASDASKIVKKFEFLKKAKQEQCHILHLNEKGMCIFDEIVAIGSEDSVSVSATDVLRSAIWMGRKNVVVVHNHPASATPSKEDISWTLALKKGAFELHGIHIMDHVILGKEGYFSFREGNIL